MCRNGLDPVDPGRAGRLEPARQQAQCQRSSGYLPTMPRLNHRHPARQILAARAIRVPRLPPFDLLHGEVWDLVDQADGVHRHDPRVLQPARHLGLELEPLDRPRIERRGQGKHFQGDPRPSATCSAS